MNKPSSASSFRLSSRPLQVDAGLRGGLLRTISLAISVFQAKLLENARFVRNFLIRDMAQDDIGVKRGCHPGIENKL